MVLLVACNEWPITFYYPATPNFHPTGVLDCLNKTRQTFISSLFDIVRSVEESAILNVAELVGLHNGTALVPTYDWVTYLVNFFKKLPKIKLFHHFCFHEDYPGTIFCKEKAINLLQNGRAPTLENYHQRFLPAELARNGLNICTKKYENFVGMEQRILLPLQSHCKLGTLFNRDFYSVTKCIQLCERYH